MRDRPILIWAGNRSQARDYFAKNNMDSNEALIIDADYPDKIRGINGAIVIRVGTWFEHKYADEFNLRLLAQRSLIVNES